MAVAVVVPALSCSGSTVLSGAVIAAYTVPSILSGGGDLAGRGGAGGRRVTRSSHL
ncbi:hypothetical protein ACFYOT_37360 [Saccharothrix saharensis]|uniref:hypothetical protein n=1 Tax=Saccharothrix saharensis TaxID=571190 RepID=UPI003676B4EB